MDSRSTRPFAYMLKFIRGLLFKTVVYMLFLGPCVEIIVLLAAVRSPLWFSITEGMVFVALMIFFTVLFVLEIKDDIHERFGTQP